MYPNFLNEYEEPEDLDCGREYLERGYTPIGVKLKSGEVIFTDYRGDITGASLDKLELGEGIYLIKDDFTYSNGEWLQIPKQVIYSW